MNHGVDAADVQATDFCKQNDLLKTSPVYQINTKRVDNKCIQSSHSFYPHNAMHKHGLWSFGKVPSFCLSVHPSIIFDIVS